MKKERCNIDKRKGKSNEKGEKKKKEKRKNENSIKWYKMEDRNKTKEIKKAKRKK